MRRFLDILLTLVCLSSLSSCIENDVPYPYTPLYVTSVSGDGFTTSINEITRTVTLNLEETTDIQNIVINVEYSSDATTVIFSRDVTQSLDMRYPVKVSLSVYDQSYLWTIEAAQTISRTVTAEGQIGDAVIDVDNLRVDLSISNAQDASNITITELKLGAEGITTYDKTLDEITDFSGGVCLVDVTAHGRTDTWRIYVEFVEAETTMTLCSFLATMAWVETSADTATGEECGYLYRSKISDTEWSDWTPYVVESPESGKFSATITGLTPNTDYEIKSYVGDVESPVESHTTEDIVQLSNSDLESWHTDGFVRPYAIDDIYPVWGTGNEGASGLATLTQSATDPRPGSEGLLSASLNAQGVGVGIITEFAAGNLFTGNYEGTHNTNGVISFGYPFTQRPIALKGWYKYTCGKIDYVGDNLPIDIQSDIVEGVTPDIGVIYIALGNWTPKSYTVSSKTYEANYKSPLYVYTGDVSTFFDKNGEEVIAYGSLEKSESVNEWTPFTISLDFYDRISIPTHIIIVASTSYYGDYFTGSTGSQMWLDDLELVYE